MYNDGQPNNRIILYYIIVKVMSWENVFISIYNIIIITLRVYTYIIYTIYTYYVYVHIN